MHLKQSKLILNTIIIYNITGNIFFSSSTNEVPLQMSGYARHLKCFYFQIMFLFKLFNSLIITCEFLLQEIKLFEPNPQIFFRHYYYFIQRKMLQASWIMYFNIPTDVQFCSKRRFFYIITLYSDSDTFYYVYSNFSQISRCQLIKKILYNNYFILFDFTIAVIIVLVLINHVHDLKIMLNKNLIWFNDALR